MDPTPVTDRDSFCRAARSAPAGARIPVEVRLDVADPFDAYRRARDGPWSIFLETTGGQDGWGYFGTDPVDSLTVAPDDVEDGTDGRSDSLSALESVVADEQLVRAGCDVPYPCGALGWISYDVAREIESLPDETADDRGLPRLQFGVYDRLAAWREPRDGQTTLRVTACPPVADGDDPGAAFDRAQSRASDLVDAIREGDPAVGAPPSPAGTATFESESGRAAYEERVRAVKGYVRDGDTFQANVSHRLVAPAAVHPVEAYAAVREVNPSPYSALVEFPGVDLVSASPELLLDVDGDRLRTEPIAGTRPRGVTEAEDRELEAELLGDEKERAEHAMLVDLERNDLGKVSEYGSVEVEEYRRVDRYSEVMHLVSSVVGRRRDGTSLADAIAAVFPGGTITGAPKPRTMEIIEEQEDTRRGPYTGSVGLVGFDERVTLSMTIRTVVRTGEQYALRVGAGVVHDSDPAREYDETLAKARALVRSVNEALDEGTTLAVETPAGTGDADGETGVEQ